MGGISLLPLTLMTIWDELINPFSDLANNLLGSPLLIGLTIFLFITFFALLMFIPFEALIVIEIPTLFVVFHYIPQLQMIIGILFGLLIGMGLLKWVRR